MLIKFKSVFFKNIKILGLLFLIFFTITVALYSAHQKNLNSKKYNHKIKSGETFDKILNQYLIDKKEIKDIKESLFKKVNINKLNTNQKIQIIVDQTNNKIKEFTFQISNTERIYLSRDNKDAKFNQKILTIKLDKKIIFKENTILQSLYKSATDQNIPPNTIM